MKRLVVPTLLLAAAKALALGGNPNVVFTPSAGVFPLVKSGQSAVVSVDRADWPGVLRAARDLQNDLARVCGAPIQGSQRIIVGTLGKSPAIDALVRRGKLDARAIRGKWEASVTQVVDGALVVAGSDRRGTIFALYDLSEAAGVSPWNWWADVPVRRRAEVYIKPQRYVASEPVVKYRGISLDANPALTKWVGAGFKGYNHAFYERLFELILRLRANLLWPASGGAAFALDDPLNPAKADEYGIVVGSGPDEPMMRSAREWRTLGPADPKRLEGFWLDGVRRSRSYESMVTLGSRGGASDSSPRTVDAQRRLLAPGTPQITRLTGDATHIPDDVTLLWPDDGWGNLRRVPTPAERKRTGGAGVLYRFAGAGRPRSYGWLDTNPLPKIWERMNLAYGHGASRVWVAGVGGLKPMELPLEFFLSMARDPDAMKKESLAGFTRRWAAREFGEANAGAIAALVSETTRLNARRKPESLAPGTYSLTDYREAERIETQVASLTNRSDGVAKTLPLDAQSAFYQLVAYPIKAAGNLNRLYIAVARNALYARQGRASTNDQAALVRTLLTRDAAITAYYHRLGGGKWDGLMDRPHRVDPKLIEIEVPAPAGMGIAVEGSEEAWPASDREAFLSFAPYGQAKRTITVFNRGGTPFDFTASASAPWIVLSKSEGRVEKETAIEVSVANPPPGQTAGTVTIAGAGGTKDLFVVTSRNTIEPVGFIEAHGVLAIEAEHASRRAADGGMAWETIPGYGRTLSAVAPFPVLAPSAPPGKGARLEYDLTTFHEGEVVLEALVAPSLGFVPGRGLRLAFAFDDASPQVVDVATKYLSPDWEKTVEDAARKVRTKHTLHGLGKHVLKVWAIDPGVTLQRLVVDLGGLKPSYLGPPESPRSPSG